MGGAVAAYVIAFGGYVGGTAVQSDSAVNAIRFAAGLVSEAATGLRIAVSWTAGEPAAGRPDPGGEG